MPTIPDVAVGAIIGAVIAVLGQLIGIFVTRRTVASQLKHASDESKIARDMELRRTEFLPTIEHVVRANATINRLLDPNERMPELAKILADLATHVARLHLVADAHTINAVQNYQNALMRAFMALAPARVQIDSRRSDLAAIEEKIKAETDGSEYWRRLGFERAEVANALQVETEALRLKCHAESMKVGRELPLVIIAARCALRAAD